MYWDFRVRERQVWVFVHQITRQCLDSNDEGDAYTHHECGSDYQDWKDGY